MANYTINHTCGHTQDHQIYGPGKDRESKIEWLETTKCTECWKAEQDSKRQAANTEAKNQGEKIMDAKHINTFDEVDLYFARTKKDTWPGYDSSCPLGKRGYWVGSHEYHRYLGPEKSAEVLSMLA